jgi:hypothetical protein
MPQIKYRYMLLIAAWVAFFCTHWEQIARSQTDDRKMIWSPLKVGGGGFISGLDLASDGTKVIRADSGGAYLWNAGTSIWKPVVTFSSMPRGDAATGSLLGVYEIRISPSNTSRFYMLYNGYVFRSDNKGMNWTRTSFKQSPSSDANDAQYRGMGPKMAVDPANADVVMVGTQTDGLWYTSNAGTSWTRISSVPASTMGGFLVRYDPSSPVGSNGQTQGIYASSYAIGVFHTTTGPDGIWRQTGNSPRTHQAMAIASDGIVYLTGNDNDNMLHKYAGGAWSSVSVGREGIQAGVAVDPTNPARVVVVNSSGNLSISADRGATWTGYGGNHTLTSTDIRWLTFTNGGSPSAAMYPGGTLSFDPAGTNLLYLGYGLGIAQGNPPARAGKIAWTDVSAGIEELISNRIIKPPAGKPIMAVWDQGVFRSADANVYPSTKGTTNNSGGLSAGWDVDHCADSPSTIVARVEWPGNETSGKSTDGGASWSRFAGTEYTVNANRGGMIACASSDNYLMLRSGSGPNPDHPFYTTDGGVTWNAVSIPGVLTSGVTGWNDNYYWRRHILAADRVTPNTFYMYNYGPTGSAPGIYRSSDGGATWSYRYRRAFPAGAAAFNARLVTVPGRAENLFFTQGQWSGGGTPSASPLQRSTNGGGNWTIVSNVGEVWCIGFGKAKPEGNGYPAIFIAGYVGGVFGIYRSDDNAATWISLGSNPNDSFDGIVDITGDPDVFGDVYLALQQTGFMYGRMH